ncbi:hypothetical protein B0F90DRAFT_1686599, partial [Multifurca ochricompacta]
AHILNYYESLTYLSRQFDVLASSRTPPNTPTTGLVVHPSPQSSPADDSTINHRAPGPPPWSLRSLVAPHPSPRRSLSSPALIPTLRRRPSIRSPIRAKQQSPLQSLFRRLFFIRLLELVWYALCAAAASLRVDDVWHAPKTVPRGFRRKSVVVENEPSIEGREGTYTPVFQVSSENAFSDSVVKITCFRSGFSFGR